MRSKFLNSRFLQAGLLRSFSRYFHKLAASLFQHCTIPIVSLPSDFEIEFDATLGNTALFDAIIGQSSSSLHRIILLSGQKFRVGINGISYDFTVAGTFDSRLRNYRFTRVGTDLSFYQDGVLKETITTSTATMNLDSLARANTLYLTAFLANVKIRDNVGTLIRDYKLDESLDGSTDIIDYGSDGQNGTAVNSPVTTIFTRVNRNWLGAEVLANPNFLTDTDWIKGSGWIISGGKALYDGTGGTSSIGQNLLALVDGGIFLVTIDVDSNPGVDTNPIYVGNTLFLSSHLLPGITRVIGESGTPFDASVFGRTSESLSLNSYSVKQLLQAPPEYTIHVLGDSFVNNEFNIGLDQNFNLDAEITMDGAGGTTLVQQEVRFDLTPEYYDDILIIMDGGLGDSSAAAISAIDDIVANLTHDNWVYVQPSPAENIDESPARISWDADVAAIAAHVGSSHYVECLTALQAANDGSVDDLQDVSDNIVPRSLRVDAIHETSLGARIRTAQIANFIKSNF